MVKPMLEVGPKRGVFGTLMNYARAAAEHLELPSAQSSIDIPEPVPDKLLVKVILYDPLAEAGLYGDWDEALESSDRTNEGNQSAFPVDGLKCVIKDENGDTVKDRTFESEEIEEDAEQRKVSRLELDEEIENGKTYTLEFPGLKVRTPRAPAEHARIEPMNRRSELSSEIGGLQEDLEELELELAELKEEDEQEAIDKKRKEINDINGLIEEKQQEHGDITVPSRDFMEEPPMLSCVGRIISSRQTDGGERVEISPGLREKIEVDAPGSYVVKIWLRPRCIVLHWSVGGYNPGDPARRAYHFHITGPYGDNNDNIRWKAGGQVGGRTASWRFWWHNLHVSGIDSLQRNDDVEIPIGTPTAQGSRRGYGNNRRNGYAIHAQTFHCNSAGVSFCGMLGAPASPESGHPGLGRWKPLDDEGNPDPDHWEGGMTPLTERQLAVGLREVARLCRAWRLDPMNPNELCTHYEVDRIHRGEQRKWDITWLPDEFQTGYREFLEENAGPFGALDGFGNEDGRLCEDADRRFDRKDDIPLGDWESDHAGDAIPGNTDRVSDYLRRMVKGLMDNPGASDPVENAYWDDIVSD